MSDENKFVDWDFIGTVKGLNNLAGSMLASGKSPQDVLEAMKELRMIIDAINIAAK